ncbi:MAG: Gfo/Idh/MocA family oxidoreductase [Caldilineaceae bacterium]|jgi:predicted dehydrogenase|nr:Gfo/Idh/MocA family oxidoreductase [Caldilineaceae bacterium]
MDQLRVGIVGCGEVVQIIHLPSLYRLADKFRVTAVCDASQEVLDAVGAQWNVSKRYLHYEDLVTAPEVDIVLVANPHVYHASVTLAAVAAGKHVLVEKPAAMNLAECDAVQAAQEHAGAIVQVAYMRRYAPAFEQACTIVGKMRVEGDVRLARVHDVIGHNAQFIKPTARVVRGQDIPQAMLAAGKELEAEAIAQAIGAASKEVQKAYMMMLGLSSHDISAMRELLGMPQRVLHATQRGGLYLTATFDYGAFVCQFDTGVDHLPRFDANLEVFGERKYVRVQYDTPYVLNLPIRLYVSEAHGEHGVVEQMVHPSWGDAFVNEWLALHTNITEQRAPKTSIADYRQDLELFQAMTKLMA